MITIAFFLFIQAYCQANSVDLGLTAAVQNNLLWLMLFGEIIWMFAVGRRKG